MRSTFARVGIIAALAVISACSGRDVIDAIDKPKDAETFLTEVQTTVRKAGVIESRLLSGNSDTGIKGDLASGQVWTDYSKTPVVADFLEPTPGQPSARLLMVSPKVIYLKGGGEPKWLKVTLSESTPKDLKESFVFAPLRADPLAALQAVPGLKTVDGFRSQGKEKLGSEELSVWQAELVANQPSTGWKTLADPTTVKVEPKSKTVIQIWLDDKNFPRVVVESHGESVFGFELIASTAGKHFAIPAAAETTVLP